MWSLKVKWCHTHTHKSGIALKHKTFIPVIYWYLTFKVSFLNTVQSARISFGIEPTNIMIMIWEHQSIWNILILIQFFIANLSIVTERSDWCISTFIMINKLCSYLWIFIYKNNKQSQFTTAILQLGYIDLNMQYLTSTENTHHQIARIFTRPFHLRTASWWALFQYIESDEKSDEWSTKKTKNNDKHRNRQVWNCKLISY